jgi:hypothetical protein
VTASSQDAADSSAWLARHKMAIVPEDCFARIPDLEINATKLFRMRAALTNQVEQMWLRQSI